MATTTVTVKSSGGDYTTLAAAEAGERADLVATTTNLIIECYPINDTAAVSFTEANWTTNATYPVTITCPVGYRHSGVWTTDAYNLVYGAAAVALNMSSLDFVIEYLQVSSTSSGTNPTPIQFQQLTTSTLAILHDCIFKQSSASAIARWGMIVTTYVAKTVIVYNCIIYLTNTGSSGSARGVITYGAGTIWFINCTIIGKTYGTYNGMNTGGSHKMYNTYTYGSTASYGTAGTGSATFSSVAGNDTNANLAYQSIAKDTSTFVNVTSGTEDFHLVSGSPLIDKAFNLRTQSYPLNLVQTDIDGTWRDPATGNTWDNGADEYDYHTTPTKHQLPAFRPFI